MKIIDSAASTAPMSGTEKTLGIVTYYEWSLDEETRTQTEKAFECASDYIHRVANEPSIGMYHCTTHISRAVPKLRDMQVSLRGVCREVDRAIYECTDATRAVSSMQELVAFRNTKDSISRSIAIVEAMQRGKPYQPPLVASRVPTGISSSSSSFLPASSSMPTGVSSAGASGDSTTGHPEAQGAITMKSF